MNRILVFDFSICTICIVINTFSLLFILLGVLVISSCPLVVLACISSNRLKSAARLLSIRATDTSIFVSLLLVAICEASNCPILSFVTSKSLSIPSLCSFTNLSKCCMMPLVRGECGILLFWDPSPSLSDPVMVKQIATTRKQVKK